MATSDYQLIPYDFDTLKTDIITKLKTKSEWKDIAIDDTILQLFVYVLTYFESFIIGTFNNTFNDYFPSKSAAIEGVFNYANFIGKQIIRKVSSYTNTDNIKFTLDAAHSKQVLIPVDTIIGNIDSSVVFSTIENKTINVGQTSIYVNVIQGIWKELNYNSDGSDAQQYFIYDDVENSNVYVKVNGTSWTKTDNFFFSVASDNHFMIKTVKGGIYILFSNGIYGAKPLLGDTINIKYLKTAGLLGNIYYPNIVTNIISPIYDSDDVKVDNINVTNEYVIKNGYDGETLNDVKNNVASYLLENPYITRREEYRQHILTLSFITDVAVYAGWELLPANVLNYASIFFYVVKNDSTDMTQDEKQALSDHIRLKDFFIVDLQIRNALYVGVYNGISIKFNVDNLNITRITEIKNEIGTIINNFYNYDLVINQYGTIFRNIYESEITKLIMGIPEIKKVNLNLQSVENVGVVTVHQSTYTKILSFENLKESYTYLYINDDKIGVYNPSWELVVTTRSYWVGKITSSIDISSKSITVTILSAPLPTPEQYINKNLGKTFYLRTNPLNNDDLISNTKNVVFNEYDYDITIET